MFMMTSSNGNIFRVTGPLCGEFTGPGEFPTQRPVTRSFDVLFDLRLNKRLSKQPWGWWFETPSWSLWRQRNVITAGNYVSEWTTVQYWLLLHFPNVADLRLSMDNDLHPLFVGMYLLIHVLTLTVDLLNHRFGSFKTKSFFFRHHGVMPLTLISSHLSIILCHNIHRLRIKPRFRKVLVSISSLSHANNQANGRCID